LLVLNRAVNFKGLRSTAYAIVALLLAGCGDDSTLGEFEEAVGEMEAAMAQLDAMEAAIEVAENQPCEQEKLENEAPDKGFPVPLFPGGLSRRPVHVMQEHDDGQGATHRWEAGLQLKPGEYEQAITFYKNYVETFTGWTISYITSPGFEDGVPIWMASADEPNTGASNDMLTISVLTGPLLMDHDCYLPHVSITYLDVMQY